MDIQQLQNDKLIIINWISQLQDYSLLEKVKVIMNGPDVCLLYDEQKIAIDEALQSIENQGTKPHHEVMEETRNRFPHLFNR
jgi:hypothetical protein